MPVMSQDRTSAIPRSVLYPVLRTLIRGGLIACLLVGANITATILWQMYDTSSRSAPRLVTVDLNGIVQDFVVETAKSELSGPEKRARTEAFAQQLDLALKGLAERQNMVILPTPAVIAGVSDITEAVKKGLAP